MAQAARLNLRMQKELKLLLSDPPHGASFPILSDSDSSAAVTLSSIDALIEGPEGTVYEKGVFHIKIQIPELYPFQPPSVTFRTPLYHPNIDTGGRICLDILNLPPKGAWQPSLNISTVLTSIGLLLSEPNPDDGLMCEASREYKYNRQIFDQKARSMTEKYAQAGASSQSILTGSRPSTMENERPNQEKKCEVDQTLSEKKSLGLSRKLSLDLSSAKKESVCDGKSSEAPNHLLHPANCEEQIKIVAPKNEAGGNNVNSNKQTGVKLSLTRRKLSPSSSCQSQQRDEVSLQNVLPNAHHSASNPQPDSTACSETSSIHSAIDNHHTNYDQDQHKRLSLSSKKPCQVFQPQSVASIDPSAGQIHIISDTKPVKFTSKIKKLSLGLKRPLQIEDNDNKENLNSRHESGRKQPYGKEKHALGVSTPLKSQQMSKDSSCVWNMKSSKDDNGKLYAQNTRLKLENSHVADDVIVLDSEDSDEDFRPIARKPLGKIWRANVGV